MQWRRWRDNAEMTTVDSRRRRAPRPGEGRPTKFTPAVQTKILQHVRLGSPYEIACRAAGISWDCLRLWFKEGEQDDLQGRITPKSEFFAAVKAAEAETVAVWLAQMEKAAQSGQWQAAAWRLERRFPQLFGMMQARQGVVNINILVGELTQQLKQLIPDPALRLQLSTALAAVPSITQDGADVSAT